MHLCSRGAITRLLIIIALCRQNSCTEHVHPGLFAVFLGFFNVSAGPVQSFWRIGKAKFWHLFKYSSVLFMFYSAKNNYIGIEIVT